MIVCLGDLFLDIFIRRRRGAQGEDVPAEADVAAGGAAANTAAWLARREVPTGLIGAVGDDAAGDMLLADLGRRGIRSAVSRIAGQRTGVCLYETHGDGRISASAQRGANDWLEIGPAQQALLQDAAWLHLSAYAFFAARSRPLVLGAIQSARAAGTPISIDLGAPHLVQHIGLEEYRRLLQATGARVLFANELEARLLMGSGTDDPLAAIAGLAGIAVVKRGAAGCSVLHDGRRLEFAARPAEEVDATGAGDAFAAGVIASLAMGGDVETAMQAGVETGAQCVALVGGRPAPD